MDPVYPSQGKLLKTKLEKNGKPVRTEIYKDNVNLDDFSIAEDGNVYCTTHPGNVIYLIKEKGKPEIIAAGEEDGVRGNTAAIFGENRGVPSGSIMETAVFGKRKH